MYTIYVCYRRSQIFFIRVFRWDKQRRIPKKKIYLTLIVIYDILTGYNITNRIKILINIICLGIKCHICHDMRRVDYEFRIFNVFSLCIYCWYSNYDKICAIRFYAQRMIKHTTKYCLIYVSPFCLALNMLFKIYYCRSRII